MIKSILFFVLIIVALLLWTRVEPEEDDPYIVNMEYDCSKLLEYETVPPEVMEECTKRLGLGLIKSNK
jgi:hypothetical protein